MSATTDEATMPPAPAAFSARERTSARPSPLPTVVSWLVRLGFAGVFLVAGFEKVVDPEGFAEQIANYQLLSEWAAWGAALFPSVEIAAAVTVLVAPPPWRRSAVIVLLGLLVVFTGAIIHAWARGIDTDCGCFGQGSTPIGIWSVLRNGGLMVTGAILLWLTPRSRDVRMAGAASVR